MTENVSRTATREDGQGLIELVVALTILAIGIGSLLTLLSSSAVSLQRSDQKGTALVLAEKQLELYRSDGYRDIRLDDALVAAIPASSVYMTANSSDSTIPSGATGVPATSYQRVDTALDSNPCLPTTPLNPTPDNPNSLPLECVPVQNITGPDHRPYEIDTYIHTIQPNGGDWVALVTVVVRNGSLTSRPILARSASSFSSVNVANVNGKSIVKLSFTGPKADVAGVQVSSSSISATLSNTNAASGQINFYVLEPPNTPSSPCGTVGPWVSLGPATVTGNGTYHPSGNYPASGPGPAAGTYYWYAAYTGDSQNKKASSVCGASTARMVVQAGKWSPSLSVSTTASTGVTNVAVPGSAITAALTGSSGTTTSAITYSVYGPSASAPATCGSGAGWSTIGTVTPNGNGSYAPASGFTPTAVGTYWYYASFAADPTNNGATSTCGSTMAKTVVTVPPDTFGISVIGSQTAGTAFTVGTITAQLYSGGTDTTYSGTKTLIFSGPGTSANGNAPSYPATVTFTNGIATSIPITLYKAETTSLTATQGLITGTTAASFTVAGKAASAFTIDTVGTQTAGAAFGVTVRAVDMYGNAASYAKPVTVSWTATPANSPNGDVPYFPSTATSLTFANFGGQGVAVATGIKLYGASGTKSLKVTESAPDAGFTGTSANFVVNAAAASIMAFINCTQPTNANTTCTGAPLSTGNNGTLQANVVLKDQYGNVATTASALTINLTSSSTNDYTVSPSPSVTIPAGGSQSNQLTVTPAKNNPAVTTIKAHDTSSTFGDVTIQVQK